jgi:hypothetical protein
LTRSEDGLPAARVVDTIWWTGRHHEQQLRDILLLWDRWLFSHVAFDASGIGYGLAQLLERRHPDRLEAIVFTRQRKSELAYNLLGMVNTDRFAVYARDESPECRQMWWEIEHARYQMRERQVMSWEVSPVEGHDDFVVSLALAARAASTAPPAASGGIIRATPFESVDQW